MMPLPLVMISGCGVETENMTHNTARDRVETADVGLGWGPGGV